MFDLVIRGGMVVDGTGRPSFHADLGIRAGKVAAIGDLAAAATAQVIDARGLVVAPGFIDIHGHSDFTVLADPRAQSAIAQGVTTEVIGNCGHGCAPVRDPADVRANVYGVHPSVPVDWRTLDEYLDRIARARPAINVAPLVAHGAIRLTVMGWQERPATPAEIETMAQLVGDLLDAGAFGISTGLEYVPGLCADEAELTAICRTAAERGAIHAAHVRNRDITAIEAIAEVIQIANRTGVALQISHLIPRHGVQLGGTAERAIELVDAARARGQDVTFDAHTRTYSLTNLGAALPSWACQGGMDRLRERLADPAQRAEMAKHDSIVARLARINGWDRVYLRSSGAYPQWIGWSFQAIGDALGVSPFDALCEIVRAEPGDPMAPLLVSPVHTEREVEQAICHPCCMVGSDATVLATDGPLADQIFPGAFTWAAWFYRHFVRERKLLSLEQAIHKLTGQPAKRIGLTDRGVLREGAWADLAIFDPATFGERGTLEQPNQLAAGMVHVLVNGVVALRDGRFTADRGGQVLRRVA